MLWVLVFGGIALAGVVMLVCYGVWLAHKAADVVSEVAVLADRLGQLGELVAQIQSPAPAGWGGSAYGVLPSDLRAGSEEQAYDKSGGTKRRAGSEES